LSIETVLAALDRPRRTGDGRWVARCPAHDDRGPSLSVRDVGDGRTLIYCFAGCETADILGALGLSWGDLYPVKRPTDASQRRRRATLTTAADALRCLGTEATIVAIAASDIAQGRPLSEADRQRLLEAAGRIARASDACHA
jgi:hypothetical protein